MHEQGPVRAPKPMGGFLGVHFGWGPPGPSGPLDIVHPVHPLATPLRDARCVPAVRQIVYLSDVIAFRMLEHGLSLIDDVDFGVWRDITVVTSLASGHLEQCSPLTAFPNNVV